MEKAIQPVNVRILDKEYLVACPVGEQDALIASARRVDREMRKIRDSGKILNSDRIAVMVALNLAHELMHGKSHHHATVDAAVSKHLQKIQQRLDIALDKHKA